MKNNKKTLVNILAIFGGVFIILLSLTILIALVAGDSSLTLGDKVGVVKVEGMITDPTEINRQIQDFAERDDIKAVVIRIDSPGGAVGPSQEIYEEVKRLSQDKKVVASMGAIAASGGYYIAVGADKIIANPGT
ncbi:MAG: S49 family peptidase, partial [Thermodesulfobacteriota bacterium]